MKYTMILTAAALLTLPAYAQQTAPAPYSTATATGGVVPITGSINAGSLPAGSVVTSTGIGTIHIQGRREAPSQPAPSSDADKKADASK